MFTSALGFKATQDKKRTRSGRYSKFDISADTNSAIYLALDERRLDLSDATQLNNWLSDQIATLKFNNRLVDSIQFAVSAYHLVRNNPARLQLNNSQVVEAVCANLLCTGSASCVDAGDINTLRFMHREFRFAAASSDALVRSQAGLVEFRRKVVEGSAMLFCEPYMRFDGYRLLDVSSSTSGSSYFSDTGTLSVVFVELYRSLKTWMEGPYDLSFERDLFVQREEEEYILKEAKVINKVDRAQLGRSIGLRLAVFSACMGELDVDIHLAEETPENLEDSDFAFDAERNIISCVEDLILSKEYSHLIWIDVYEAIAEFMSVCGNDAAVALATYHLRTLRQSLSEGTPIASDLLARHPGCMTIADFQDTPEITRRLMSFLQIPPPSLNRRNNASK